MRRSLRLAGQLDPRVVIIGIVLLVVAVGAVWFLNRPTANVASTTAAPAIVDEAPKEEAVEVAKEEPAPAAVPEAAPQAAPEPETVAVEEAAPPAPSRKGPVWKGKVTDAVSGKPIQGASVGVQAAAKNLSEFFHQPVVNSVLTDENGEYSIQRLPAGARSALPALTILVEAEGYETMRGIKGMTSNSAEDFVLDFALRPGATITGIVVNEQDAGIPGAVISAFSDEAQQGFMGMGMGGNQSVTMSAPSTKSEADGTFVLEGAAAGESYRLLATADGYIGETTDLTPSGTANVRIKLVRGTAGLTVRVVEGDGTPAPGAMVQAIPQNVAAGGMDMFKMMSKIKAETTDAEGKVVLTGLAPGDYQIMAVDGTLGTPGVVPRYIGQQVELDKDKPVEITLTFPGKRAFIGKAIDADGDKPLPGVRFSDTAYQNTVFENGVARVTPNSAPGRKESVSDHEGKFRLEIASSHGAQIYYEAPNGYILEPRPGIHPNMQGSLYIQVESNEGDIKSDIYFRRGSKVRGLVLLPDGTTPAPGVMVSATPKGQSQTDSKATGADGRFELMVPSNTEIRVQANSDHGIAATTLMSKGPDEAEEITLRLQGYASASGSVTADGEPVAGVQVVAEIALFENHTTWGAQAVTDAEGYYFLEKIQPGDVALKIQIQHNTPFPYTVPEPIHLTMEPDKYYQRQDFELEEGELFEGVVVDEEDKPIEGVQISGGIDNWSRHLNQKTDAEGKFSITGIQADSNIQFMNFSHAEYDSFHLQSASLEDSPLRVVLKKRGGIVLKVLSQGQPVGKFRYRLLGAQGNGLFQDYGGLPKGIHESASGDLELKNLQSSRFRAEVAELDDKDMPTGLRGTTDFEASGDDAAKEVIVSLSTGAGIYGRVALADGTPIAEAIVRIPQPVRYNHFGGTSENPNDALFGAQPAKSDASGNYVIKNVPNGKHRVEAVKDGYIMAKEVTADVQGTAGASGVDIVLTKAGVIFGKVIDQDGNPVPKPTLRHRDNARSQLTGNWNEVTVVGDEEGNYRIENCLAGYHTITLAASTTLTRNQSFQLEAGEEKELNFDFASQIKLTGKILANGKPIPQNTLHLYIESKDGSFFPNITQSGDGTYTTFLAPGSYSASYRRQGLGGVLKLGDFVLDAEPKEQTKDFNLEFVDGDVVVVFPSDQDFTPGTVSIAPPGSDFKDNFLGVQISQASHRFKDLMPGEYIATYTSRNKEWRGDSETVMLAKGEENMIIIDVKKVVRGAKVGEWKSGDLTTEFQTYSYDITQHVASPGRLTFLVEFTGGNSAVRTEWASLEENGVEIGRDAHSGWSGMSSWANAYTFDLAARRPGASYTLKLNFRADGDTNSVGHIHLNMN